jgi:hypothetical protein
MSNDNEYVRYSEHGPQGVNVAERSVVIKGGSGINRKHVQTPLGVHTAISDEDMEWLKDNYAFRQHQKNGYIAVRKQRVDPEVAAADMVTHDQKTDSCPVVPQDFTEKEVAKGLTSLKPKVNKAA